MATATRPSKFETRKSSIDSTAYREEVEKILQLEPKDRTKRNIDLLKDFFKTNRFFKQQAEHYDDKTIQYLFRNLRFAEFQQREAVFNY